MSIADNRETTYSTARKHSFIQDIMHDLRKSLRGAPHSMSEIRQGMSILLRNQTEFIEVLKEHHNYLKESIVVCLDKLADDNERASHLDRLINLFEMHAKAEEQTLYKVLISSSEREPRINGNLAQDEHELIYRLADELRDMHFESLWTEDVEAKAIILCEIVTRHLQKEEQDIFPLTEDQINSGQLNNLTSEYINLCENYLGMSEIRAKGIFL